MNSNSTTQCEHWMLLKINGGCVKKLVSQCNSAANGCVCPSFLTTIEPYGTGTYTVFAQNLRQWMSLPFCLIPGNCVSFSADKHWWLLQSHLPNNKRQMLVAVFLVQRGRGYRFFIMVVLGHYPHICAFFFFFFTQHVMLFACEVWLSLPSALLVQWMDLSWHRAWRGSSSVDTSTWLAASTPRNSVCRWVSFPDSWKWFCRGRYHNISTENAQQRNCRDEKRLLKLRRHLRSVRNHIQLSTVD